MSDYYSILEITPEATSTEIKKAYFKLVRKYPPERHPEEFKRIREAYEVLIDQNTRKQYDEIETLPEQVKKIVRYGEKTLEEGNTSGVINLLEHALKIYPRFTVIKNLLGEAYNANGNTGKAVTIFKELVSQEPENAGFAGKLAHAYLERGWHKKAIKQYKKALDLDQDNISLWLGLIDSHLKDNDKTTAREVAYEALEVSNHRGWDNLELYYHIIQIDIFTGSIEELKQHISEMQEKASTNNEDKSNVAWFLATLSKNLLLHGMTEQSNMTINTAFELLPEDEEIKEIREYINSKTILMEELFSLKEDVTIDEVFKDMMEFELQNCNCPQCQDTQLSMETYILSYIENMRSSIRKIKSNYPSLYSLKKDFFDQAINPKKTQYLIENQIKKTEKFKKQHPEFFEDDIDGNIFLDDNEEDEDYFFIPPEPVKREGPKIGRNEPCPCGSGKKYKKCCG